MSPAYSSAARAYAHVSLETGVASAEPHKLITMLYDAALLEIARGKAALSAGDIEARGRATSKAIQIIEEGLSVALDSRRGGDLARNLRDLYGYMTRRLLLASLKTDAGGYDEVSRLLGSLRDAWLAIDPRSNSLKAA